eukprot:SM000187S03912  [mRNA]  locus=s187:66444:68879:- [translate_table: standard]
MPIRSGFLHLATTYPRDAAAAMALADDAAAGGAGEAPAREAQRHEPLTPRQGSPPGLAPPGFGAGGPERHRDGSLLLGRLSWELKLAIFRRLSIQDLLRLSEVNKYYHSLCSRDDLWMERAMLAGVGKGADEHSWKWNYVASVIGIVHAKVFDDSNPSSCLQLHGDVWIGDPAAAFFAGESNKRRWHQQFVPLMEALDMSDVILTYRGISCAIVHARYGDGAYPVVRHKEHKGFVFTESGMLAVVPLRLMEILERENGKTILERENGKTVLEREKGKTIPSSHSLTLEDVHGFVCTSRDGDFMITASDPAKGIRQQLGAAMEAYVDDNIFLQKLGVTMLMPATCCTGGYWTMDSDSDSDSESDADQPLTEEDLAEIAAMERRHKENAALAKSAVETVVHPSAAYYSCQSLGVLAGGFMDEAKLRVSPFTR